MDDRTALQFEESKAIPISAAKEWFQGCYDVEYFESYLEVSFDTMSGVNRFRGYLKTDPFIQSFIFGEDDFAFVVNLTPHQILKKLQKAGDFFRSGKVLFNLLFSWTCNKYYKHF